ncbi:LysR family transcriptional regulator [Oryzibacter oryziterrae]|uniref:LysR family transcriptional regulator n=1 Tax=Oryzibacter oryziterrae TaxID=2766474 RepID=UPI001F42AA10|nr:LysR family transcriptional regulator [Oryzibacter oryziterrae]
MDLSRLRTLRELSKRGTMAAVAEALFISPSAVSQQIALLEDEAGVSLIERRGRGVRLTPAGQRLVAQADRIFAILEEARTDLAEARAEVAGELTFAAFPSVAASLVPAVMRDLEIRFPALRVTLQVMEPDEAINALRAWQVDAAMIDSFTIDASETGGAFETVPVCDDRLFAVLPPGHVLAERETLGLEDLKGEKWALDTASSAYSSAILEASRRAGFQPEVNGYCNGFEVVSAMVEAGCSISVMPGLLISSYRGGFVARPIEPEIRRNIAVAIRRGERRKPAIAALVERLGGG